MFPNPVGPVLLEVALQHSTEIQNYNIKESNSKIMKNVDHLLAQHTGDIGTAGLSGIFIGM